MTDIGPYGVTQNPDTAAVTADALVGERAGNVTADQATAGYAPAQFSTAPYNPPKPPVPPPLACGYKNCRQPATDTGYCERHQS